VVPTRTPELSAAPPDGFDRWDFCPLVLGTSGGRLVDDVVVVMAAPPLGAELVWPAVAELVGPPVVVPVLLEALLDVLAAGCDEPPQAATGRHSASAASHRRETIGPA
jgi:hypothetical protein